MTIEWSCSECFSGVMIGLGLGLSWGHSSNRCEWGTPSGDLDREEGFLVGRFCRIAVSMVAEIKGIRINVNLTLNFFVTTASVKIRVVR